jgi:hypothetical protein
MARGKAAEGNGTEQAKDSQPGIMVAMPQGLKDKIVSTAESKNLSAAAWVRQLLADRFEYVLPPMAQRGPKRVYLNEDEKKAAQKAAQDKRNALMRALLAKYNAGEIDIPGLEVASA